MSLRTPLCDLLGIEVPIFSVGFGDSARPELAAAVSNAGGLGVIGASSAPPDEVRRRIERTREQTERPFGVNVIIAALGLPDIDERFRVLARARVAAAIEERVPVLVLFWGDPAEFVAAAHGAGVTLLIQVGSIEEARAAVEAGVDAVIVQGVEAGGHVKATESIWDVLPRTVEAVKPTPVVASGGIGDGHAVARALALGAQGVSLGTRFVASEEAWIHQAYKERVVAANAEDTFYGDLFNIGWPDAPHRALKNRTYEEWDAAGRPPVGARPGEDELLTTLRMPWGEERPWYRYTAGMVTPEFDGDLDYAVMWAGASVDSVRDVKPAAAIVRELVGEAEASLAATR